MAYILFAKPLNCELRGNEGLRRIQGFKCSENIFMPHPTEFSNSLAEQGRFGVPFCRWKLRNSGPHSQLVAIEPGLNRRSAGAIFSTLLDERAVRKGPVERSTGKSSFPVGLAP